MIFLIFFFFFHEYLNDCAIVIYVLSFSKKKFRIDETICRLK